ncbi:MAG: hypothetical protein HQK61_08210 [Desulfamplus sp.]|nr:hypothetical protein [Desulfamplus sp.]
MRKHSFRSIKDDDSGSFELLLDTMCNTFGGIVFIALLLSLLSQSAEINNLSSISDHSGTNYSGSNLSLKDDLNNNTDSDSSIKELLKKVEQVKSDISAKERKNQLENQIKIDQRRSASTQESIKSLEKEVVRLKQEIASSQKPRQRELRLPRLHKIEKSPVFIAIRQGRFYTITDVSYSIADLLSGSWGNSGRGYDASDNFIREYNNVIYIEPLAGKGQTIRKGSENMGKILQAISNINPQKEFVTFAVYPDSFSEFNYVKNIFIDRGFDYNWFIIKDRLSLAKGSGALQAQ